MIDLYLTIPVLIPVSNLQVLKIIYLKKYKFFPTMYAVASVESKYGGVFTPCCKLGSLTSII